MIWFGLFSAVSRVTGKWWGLLRPRCRPTPAPLAPVEQHSQYISSFSLFLNTPSLRSPPSILSAFVQAAHPYLHPSVATFKHIYLYHSSSGKRGMVGLFYVQVCT